MNTYLTIRLISITEPEFYYLKTLNYLESDAYDDYLSEPPLIPGNVKNGTGMVGFSSENGVTMHVIKDYNLKDDEY